MALVEGRLLEESFRISLARLIKALAQRATRRVVKRGTCRRLLDDEALSGKVHAEGVEVSVLYANGSPAGYYELDFSVPASTSLVYFGLMAQWTGRGIGPWLLGSAISEGFARGAEFLTLNTCTLDHPAALPLYQRLGFRPVGEEVRRLSIPPHIPIPDHIAARMAP